MKAPYNLSNIYTYIYMSCVCVLFSTRPLPKTVERIFWNTSNFARSAHYAATSELPTTCTYCIYMWYNIYMYIVYVHRTRTTGCNLISALYIYTRLYAGSENGRRAAV